MIVSDNFNRADGSLGSNWSEVITDCAVITGGVVTSGSVAVTWFQNRCYWNGIFSSNQFSQATVINSSGVASVACRMGADFACYLLWTNGSEVDLGYCPGSSSGNVTLTFFSASTVISVPAGTVLRLEVTGQGTGNIVLAGYVNGTKQVGYTVTGGDPVYNSGNPGFSLYDNFSKDIDNFSGGDLGLTDGLVGWWTMDQSSGTSVKDASGNNNNGTMGGIQNPTWVSGKIYNALAFDNTQYEFVDLGNPAVLQLGSTGTVACWVNTTATDNLPIISKSDFPNGLNGYVVATNYNGGGPGKLVARTANGTSNNTIYSNSVVGDGAWHHIVFTWDGSFLNLYFDGNSDVTPTSQTLTPVSNVYNLSFARNSAGNNYNWSGSLDDVRIYNRALSAAEVTALYNWRPQTSSLNYRLKLLGKTVVSDNFNRADGGLGANWAVPLGAMNIASNIVVIAGGAGSFLISSAYWSANSFGTEQFSQITVGNMNDSVGPTVRVQSSGAGYWLSCWPGHGYAFATTDGTGALTQIGAAVGTVVSGDVARMEVTGQGLGNIVLKSYVNGSFLSSHTVSGGDLVFNSGSPGMLIANYPSAPTLDNWSGGDL